MYCFIYNIFIQVFVSLVSCFDFYDTLQVVNKASDAQGDLSPTHKEGEMLLTYCLLQLLEQCHHSEFGILY